jgi:hypothetical protein
VTMDESLTGSQTPPQRGGRATGPVLPPEPGSGLPDLSHGIEGPADPLPPGDKDDDTPLWEEGDDD